VTLPMRARGRRGRLQGLAPSNYAWLRYTPRNLLLRAVVFALLAIVFLAPVRVTACLLLDLLPMRLMTFTLVNVIYGGIVNAIFGSLIIRAAMNDVASREQRAQQ